MGFPYFKYFVWIFPYIGLNNRPPKKMVATSKKNRFLLVPVAWPLIFSSGYSHSHTMSYHLRVPEESSRNLQTWLVTLKKSKLHPARSAGVEGKRTDREAKTKETDGPGVPWLFCLHGLHCPSQTPWISPHKHYTMSIRSIHIYPPSATSL